MRTIKNCKGDLAYYLTYGLTTIPDSHYGDDDELQDQSVVHYLSHIKDAGSNHPLKRFETSKLINTFHKLWDEGDYKTLSSIEKFRVYMKPSKTKSTKAFG